MTDGTKRFKKELIAPCGINCGTCMIYMREKKPCGGCRTTVNKPKHCITCRIKNCELLPATTGFCFECIQYPCSRLKQLDKRYIKNYQFSLISNLQEIQQKGICQFLEEEEARWNCPFCKAPKSIHIETCTCITKKE